MSSTAPMPFAGSIQNSVLKIPAQLRLPGARLSWSACAPVTWKPSPNPSRPALEFCPEGDMIVRAEVEQEFAGKLTPNMRVTITDDVTNKGEWTGEVTRISDWFTHRRAVIMEPMQYNDIRTLEVIIRVTPNPANPLRINQRVRVKLEGEK